MAWKRASTAIFFNGRPAKGKSSGLEVESLTRAELQQKTSLGGFTRPVYGNGAAVVALRGREEKKAAGVSTSSSSIVCHKHSPSVQMCG